MKSISGFTFIHNAIDSGYPIVEAIRAVQPYVDEVVVVDMESTDETRHILEKLASIPVYDHTRNKKVPIRILDGFWGNEAGKTLREAHNKYIECAGDIIIHFEADEVFEDRLIRSVLGNIRSGLDSIAVHRLQLEQNFQRCRWYPEPVHRIFSRDSFIRKDGHTTSAHESAFVMEPKNGYLWDITNCFRDNWMNRVNKQAELRNESPQYLLTQIHSTLPAIVSEKNIQKIIYGERHWTWTESPFAIPEILKPLVGMAKYKPIL